MLSRRGHAQPLRFWQLGAFTWSLGGSYAGAGYSFSLCSQRANAETSASSSLYSYVSSERDPCCTNVCIDDVVYSIFSRSAVMKLSLYPVLWGSVFWRLIDYGYFITSSNKSFESFLYLLGPLLLWLKSTSEIMKYPFETH